LDATVRGAFMTHAVDGAHVHAVGDGVTPLNRFPRGLLLRAVLRFRRREPADGGGIEEDLRAAHRGEAGGLGIPLVPAHEDADPGATGIAAAATRARRAQA